MKIQFKQNEQNISNLPVEILDQVGLGALGAALALVTDRGAIALLEVVLETLLTSEEPAALLAVGPGVKGTQAELPAPSAALGALVRLTVTVAHIAGLAVVGPVDET